MVANIDLALLVQLKHKDENHRSGKVQEYLSDTMGHIPLGAPFHRIVVAYSPWWVFDTMGRT